MSDAQSPLYTGPLTIEHSTFLRARAFAEGGDPGLVLDHLFIGPAAATQPTIAAAPHRSALLRDDGAEILILGSHALTLPTHPNPTAALGFFPHGILALCQTQRHLDSLPLWQGPIALAQPQILQAGTTAAPIVGLSSAGEDYLLTNEGATSRLPKNFTGNNQDTYAFLNPSTAKGAASFNDDWHFQLDTANFIRQVSTENGWANPDFTTMPVPGSFNIGTDLHTNTLAVGRSTAGHSVTVDFYPISNQIDVHSPLSSLSFPFDPTHWGSPTGLDLFSHPLSLSPRLLVSTRDGPGANIFSPDNYILELDATSGTIEQVFRTSGSVNKVGDLLFDPETGRLALGYQSGSTGGGVQVFAYTPVRRPGLADADFAGVRQFSSHGQRGYAVAADHTLLAWGAGPGVDGAHGRTHTAMVAAGREHVLVLDLDGSLDVMGANTHGQRDIPAAPVAAVAIASGDDHALALLADGSLLAWGRNDHGQATPPPHFPAAVRQLAAGQRHSLALLDDGSVVGWGDPALLDFPDGLEDIIQIAASETHSLALRADGSVLAWGDASQGALDIPENFTARLPAPLDPPQPRTFAQWAADAQLVGPDADPLADPFALGRPNLLAYAFGAPARPAAAAETTHPQLRLRLDESPNPPHLRLRFPIRRDAALTYQAQFAASPAGPWTDAPHTLEILDDLWSEAIADDPAPEAGAPRFGRVVVGESESGE